ncbi:hypothetical protein [Planctellipticum variicoloris]|uniref:hypothetical protein n=1 Tax=Planctellipticum variicoloris TaxID=3064265 RepID=UPI003013945C|nr:hypothetical protein SH412_003858 [Planctomycetaceae bacterium SH412]
MPHSPRLSQKRKRLFQSTSLLGFLLFVSSVSGQTASEKIDCPRLQRSIGQRVLLVTMLPEERAVVEAACKEHNVGLDVVRTFDAQRDDYRRYFLIISGSHMMVYWRDPPLSEPPAFQHLEKFIRDGGHLMVFGVFNGSHMEHMRQFGVKTSYFHADKYEAVEPVADVVFAGSESLIPPGNYLGHSGSFEVSSPHVLILRRGEGYHAGHPSLATIPWHNGRVTFTTAEPRHGKQTGYWLLQVLVNWAARGAPVTAEDAESGKPIVIPIADIPSRSRLPIPDESARKAAEALISQVFGSDQPANPMTDSARELAQRYRDTAETETDSAARYLLLLRAARQSAADGDAARTVETLRKFRTDFGEPDHDSAVTIFRRLQKSMRPSFSATQALVGESIELSLRDCDRRKFDTAIELINVARELAEATRSRRLIADVDEERAYIESVRQEWSRLAPFLPQLEKDPADPVARTELGLFLCCLLGRWSDGLTVLAECQDPKLQNAASRELDLGKTDLATDMTAVGDLWSQIAKDDERRAVALNRRAAYWYSRSAAKSQGLEQAAIRKKLDDISSPRHTLRIKAPQFSGTARLRLSSRELKFEPEGEAAVPASIQLNDVTWKPQEIPILPNCGVTRVTARNLFLFTATIQPITGRGTAAITGVSADEVVIELKSSDATSTPTEFILRFGE